MGKSGISTGRFHYQSQVQPANRLPRGEIWLRFIEKRYQLRKILHTGQPLPLRKDWHTFLHYNVVNKPERINLGRRVYGAQFFYNIK
jgi:hypothetical protein